MKNRRMASMVLYGKAMDVRKIGEEIETGVFRLRLLVEGCDYCDAESERWIFSIGKRIADGEVLASTDSRFYGDPEFECIWLR